MTDIKTFYDKYNLFPLFKVRNRTEGKKKEVKTPLTVGSWKKEENQIFSTDGLKDHTSWGLVCGEKSKVMVLDIDGDISLLDELLDAATLNKNDIKTIKDTLTIKTPNGGYHLYFKYLKGLKNSASKFYNNCDFRTDGGYVVSPHSIIENDEGLNVSYIPVREDAPINDMPLDLFNFIKGTKKVKSKEVDEFTAFDEDTFVKLKGMSEGDGRNVALNEALFKHCSIHHIKDITTIRLLALAINEKYFSEPEEGFLKTADSVYKAVNEENGEYSPISEYDKCYFKSAKNGSVPISNFVLRPIKFIECIDDPSNSIIETFIITKNNQKISKQYKANDFDNVSNFDKVTNDFRTRFTGNLQDLKFIKTLVFNQIEKRIKGVNCGGMHLIDDEWYFIDNKGCINSKGEKVEDLVLMNTDGISCELSIYETITSKELQNISKSLFNFNSPEIAINIIGYTAGLFVKEKLKYLGIKHNHLFYSGEAGAGKSETLENIIIPILGITNSVQSANGCTKFAMEKIASSNNTIPYIIDEFKPGMIEPYRVKAISNMMRDIYDWHTSIRGTEALKINSIQLVAPVILSGEASTDETAIIERSLLLTFSKRESKVDNRTNAYNNIKNRQELKKLGRSLLDKGLKLSIENIKSLYDKCNKLVSDDIKVDRIKNTMAITLLGIEIVKELFNDLGLNFESETNFLGNDIVSILNNNIIAENLEGGNSTRSIVDITLEKINDMFILGYRYLPYTGFKLCRVDDDILSIQLKIIYDYFSKYVKEHGIKGNWLPWNDFSKQLQKTDYYLAHNVAIRFPSITDLSAKDKEKIIKAFKLSVEGLESKNLNIDNIIDNAKENGECN